MKTTLHYNTIETLQRQPAWKHFVDTIVDICKRHFDRNLFGVSEFDSTLNRVDEDTDLQPVYPSLSYKDDLIHLNLMENISIRGLMRVLSLYGCRILDVETEVTIPHTFKVQGKDRGGNLWGFQPTNRTYDYEANSITNVADIDEIDGNTDYTFPSMSENYFEEDKTFKYIYNIFGYNQKEPMLCYSPVYEIRQFRKLVTPDNPALQGMALYVLQEDIIDADNNLFKTGSKIYQKSGNMYYLFNASASEFTLVTGETEVDGILAVPVFYIINDNDKIDLIDAEGIIRYNSDDDDVELYENLRGISPNRTNDVFKITLTYTGVKLGDYKVYLINLYPNKYVVANNVKFNLNNLNPYYAKNILFSSDSLIKTLPVFTYHFKENGEYIDTATYTYNGLNVRGGENLLSYQFVSYPYKKKEVDEDENETIVPVVKTEYGSMYDRSISNEAGEGCVNNIEVRNPDSESDDDKYLPIDDITLREISSPNISLGNKYNTCNIYSVKLDLSDDTYKPALMLGKYYYIGDLSEGEQIFIFNDNSVFDVSDGMDKDSYVIKSYGNGSYYIGTNDSSTITEGNYILEDLRTQEYIETMYFNHFVKIYPVTNTQSDTLIATTLVYCDNLELLQYGNSIPYIVTYQHKGELDEDEKFMDLDCSIFSKIVAYNKHTHLVTLNNEVYFPNSTDGIYAVVAYQNLFPFSKPKSIRVLTPNNGVKDIVQPMVKEMFNDLVNIEFYSQKEYDDMLFWEKHNRQKVVNDNSVNVLLQELDNKARYSYGNYAIYGVMSEPNKAVTLYYETTDGRFGSVTSNVNGYLFYFSKSDLIDAENNLFYYNYESITLSGSGADYITCVRFSSDFSHLKTGGCMGSTFTYCTNLKVVAGYNPVTYDTNDFGGGNQKDVILYTNTSPIFKSDKTKFTYYSGLANIYSISLDNVAFTNDIIDFTDAFNGCKNLETISLNFKKKISANKITRWFKNCESLREVTLTNIDFSLCTDTESAFEGCTHLERIIVNWGNNTTIVTMKNMFKDCGNLKVFGNFDDWYGDNVNTDDIFDGCDSLENATLKNIH